MNSNEQIIYLHRHQIDRRRTSMKIGELLYKKGNSVKMIKPNETVGNLARQLQQLRIGVMVVSQDDQTIDGIISERDIAYSLSERRGELHLLPVSALMTRNVITCAPENTLSEAARLMQKHNIRHLPVKQDGKLIGIVSIRDVLEHRLSEIERKTDLVKSWFEDPE